MIPSRKNPPFDQVATDNTTTIAELKSVMNQFVAERDWEKFHLPKNIAMSIAIESAELMEHFQWTNPPAPVAPVGNDSPVAQEMADVLAYTLRLAEVLGIDLSQALTLKMERNRLKYPAGIEFVPKQL
ncbi:MAG: nucleotide pyrophosphohydrolase [Pirellula sp.]